jgi:hypothetical protein
MNNKNKIVNLGYQLAAIIIEMRIIMGIIIIKQLA